MPATSSARAPASASACCAHSSWVRQISRGSCSTHPGCGKSCVVSRCASARISPARSNTIARELVVPWSRASRKVMSGAAGASRSGYAKVRGPVFADTLRGAFIRIHPSPLMPLTAAGGDTTQEFVAALRRMGLVAHSAPDPALSQLAGGVSSDIVRVDLPSGPICLKRALPRLKVKADWQAPVERNRWEVAWMRLASAIEPTAVPRVLGEDPESGTFAMEFLDPSRYAVWKARLLEGEADPAFASQVGARIVSIHAHTARRSDLAHAFATDHIFFPIRLEPYLLATARVHPEVGPQLQRLIDTTGGTKLALV